MSIFKLIAAGSVAVLLTACDKKPECTEETATAKMNEIMASVQALATTNPEKLAAIAPKLQEIQAELTASGTEDPAAACAALDAIAAELAQ